MSFLYYYCPTFIMGIKLFGFIILKAAWRNWGKTARPSTAKGAEAKTWKNSPERSVEVDKVVNTKK